MQSTTIVCSFALVVSSTVLALPIRQKEQVKRMIELERGMSQEQLEHISKLRNALMNNKDCANVDREKTM
ncbi:hypothetical protein PRIPAC_81810 [Pristionchus pacificus]|uniref:Uncharacterized protein n=1 Tax=Pristionchus pacificus TaxID=54126 RepID=A0A2A6BH99_PRIPA|nr:hypothetical protein PRIPAC_81810 [Pristionchus pacificus]|eukprot:PDM65295.1 hypothetical protein PRIPAC_52237 [Pristionchus pacificus]